MLLDRPTAICRLLGTFLVKSTSLETTLVRCILLRGSIIENLYADQAPDQIPYNDDSEPETESDHALDEVSSDVEMNPEDLADILGEEEEEEDEDAK